MPVASRTSPRPASPVARLSRLVIWHSWHFGIDNDQPVRLPSHPDFHLTYCTNIHPADGWDNVRATLGRYAPALRARFAPRRRSASGCGCRRGCAGLLAGRNLDEFRGFLDAEGLYVAIINGFPYGPFHGTPVKASVYAPDWRDPARVAYTLDLIRILRRCCRPGSTAACRPRRCPTSPGWPRPTRGVGGDHAQCGADRRGAGPDPAGDRRDHSSRHRARARLLHREHRRDARVLRAPPAADRRAAARARARVSRARRRPRSAARAHPGVLRLLPLRGGVRDAADGARSDPGRGDQDRPHPAQLGARCHGAGGSRTPQRTSWPGCGPSRTRPTCIRSSSGARRAAPLPRSAGRARARRLGRARDLAHPLPRAAVHVGVRRARIDAVLRRRGACATRSRPASRATSRSRPTPGTCCRAASRWISSSRSAANTTGCCDATCLRANARGIGAPARECGAGV